MHIAPWRSHKQRWWCRIFGCSFTIFDGWKSLGFGSNGNTNTLILSCRCGRVVTGTEKINE